MASARKAVYPVQLSEFLLRRSHRGAVRRQVLDWACHLVRRGRQDAEDIFPEVRLLDAMAYRGAGRWDVLVQARQPDENSEARRDAAVHPMVAHPDEPDTCGPAEEEHPQDAVHRNWFLMPMLEFPLGPLRQVAATQEHPADRVPQAEVELLDAEQMAQLQVLPGPQEQRLQELLRVWQQGVLEQAVEKVHDQVNERLLLKAPVLVRKA